MSWKQAGVSFIRMAVLLVLVSMAAFFLVSVSPLDPLTTNVGQAALGSMSSEQIARLQEYWGVNTPPVTRYLAWAGDFLKGDMGISLLYRRPVAQVIGEKLANSLWIMAAAWILSGFIGFLMGIIAGAKKGKAADRIISSYALVTASTPAFWVALVLLVVFAVWLKLLPIGLSVPIGVEASAVTMKDRLIHGILPGAALAITGISNIALHTREKMAQVMESDYVLFARARGESEWSIIRRHGIRNILLPAMTLQFASVSEIFGGSVLVEQVFSYPGMVVYWLLGEASTALPFGSLNTYIPYLAFVIPTFSGLRLAKFNIDERQTTSFIGLPVPAHALFWASVGYSVLPVVHANEGLFVLVTVILAFITSLLLVSEIPMFSLKVKSLAWKGNELRYILIACAIIFVALWGFLGISGTILLYIVLSIFNKKG